MTRGKNLPWVLKETLPDNHHYKRWLEDNKTIYVKKDGNCNKNGLKYENFKCRQVDCPFQYRVVFPLNTEEVEIYTFTEHCHSNAKNFMQSLTTQKQQTKFPKIIKDIIDPMIFRGMLF
jgi:hypothetical protein